MFTFLWLGSGEIFRQLLTSHNRLRSHYTNPDSLNAIKIIIWSKTSPVSERVTGGRLECRPPLCYGNYNFSSLCTASPEEEAGACVYKMKQLRLSNTSIGNCVYHLGLFLVFLFDSIWGCWNQDESLSETLKFCAEVHDGDGDVLDEVPREVLIDGDGDLLIAERELTEFCLLQPPSFQSSKSNIQKL